MTICGESGVGLWMHIEMVELRSGGSLLVSMESTLLKPVLLASAARRYVRWRKYDRVSIL